MFCTMDMRVSAKGDRDETHKKFCDAVADIKQLLEESHPSVTLDEPDLHELQLNPDLIDEAPDVADIDDSEIVAMTHFIYTQTALDGSKKNLWEKDYPTGTLLTQVDKDFETATKINPEKNKTISVSWQHFS